MDLQSAFYVLAIVFLSGWIIFLTLLILTVLILFKRGKEIQASLKAKIDNPLAQFAGVAVPLMAIILPLISNLFFKRRSKT